MVRLKRLSRGVVFPLVIALAASSTIATTANAELVGSNAAIEKYNAKQARDRLEAMIQREDVQKEFKQFGISPAEAKARVDAMSDEQVAQVVNRLDREPAGSGTVGTVVGAALIVFLVLLVTDILCLTHVFKFTKCA
jgi:cysteine synthase